MYDRTTRLKHYRQLASLAGYVLVSMDRPRVEVISRQGDRWLHRTAEGLHAAVRLTGVPVAIALSGLFEDVELTPRTRLHPS